MDTKTRRRDIVVAFRLTPLEAAHVDEAGQALRQPRRRSDFCRAAALFAARQKVPEPMTPARRPARRLPALDTRLLAKLLAETGRIGGFVNLLAQAADTSGALPTAERLATVAADVMTLRNEVSRVLRGGGVADGDDP